VGRDQPAAQQIGDENGMKSDGLNRDPAMLGTSGFVRRRLDAYFTPAWVTEALLSKVDLPSHVVWEPAAGRGDMVAVLKRAGFLVYATDIIGPDLGCIEATKRDFLEADIDWSADSIITNPPFDQIEPFIRKALELTRPGQHRVGSGGLVAILARHEFDCAAGRNDLFTRSPFARKVVLTKRPKWVEVHTASPRFTYAWFVWDWRHRGEPTVTYAPEVKCATT
jgi:hypothetical protein